MILSVAVPLFLSLAQTPQAPDSLARDRVVGPLGARIDSQLTRFADYGFSGSVLVVRDKRVVLLKGYGLADVERRVPNTAATRFEMNSMTKMFTGVGILQLAADRRLQLSDSVWRYLGDFPLEKRGATIEQLAMHTSGLIVDGASLAEDSRESFVRDVKRTPRESAPGERYRYTNAGYSLLAAIIESVTGDTYEAYLRRVAFAPAGMRTAVFRNEVPANDRLFAHGYVGTPAALEAGPPNPYVWGTKGAGGVWTTVGDMYRWLVAVDGQRVVPNAQWRILTAPPRPPSQEAYGWHVDTAADGRPRIQKGGGSDDFASQLLYYPRDQIVVIWASNNLRQRWRRTLNDAIPGMMFAGVPVRLPALVPPQQSTLKAQAGRYVAGRDTITLRAGEGFLYAEANRREVPTNVMFFPTSESQLTGFDPATQAMTRLEFTATPAQSVVVRLADGRRITGIKK